MGFRMVCYRRGWQTSLLLLMGASVGLAQGQHETGKTPLPDAALLKRSEELLREVYGSELKAAKKPQERGALARKLLAQAEQSRGNTVDYFALLRAARKLATGAADVELALEAVRRIAETYDVDGIAEEIKTIEALGKTAAGAAQYQELAENVIPVMQRAADAQRYDAAVRAGQLGTAAARRARQYRLAKQIDELMKDIGQRAEVFAGYQAALEVLERMPTDPAANLAAARYLCFVRGDWKAGIPLLALGEDAELREVAQMELRGAEQLDQLVAVGDAWWSLAERREGQEKQQAMLRAGAWYQFAKTRGIAGLTKVKLETRLTKLAQLKQPLTRLELPASSAAAARPEITGARLRHTLQHQAAVNAIAFSPDGKTLASNGLKEAIHFWNPETGEEARVIRGVGQNLNNLAFSPDGRLLVAVGGRDDQAIHFVNVATGRELRSIPSTKVWFKPVVFSPDGKLLATGGDGGEIQLWNADNGRAAGTLAGHKGWSFGLDFARSGKQLASTGADKLVRVWSLSSRQVVQEMAGHQDRVWSVAFTPDAKTLASSSADRSIMVWDPQTGQRRSTLQGHTKWVRDIAVSPDGKTLASAGYDFTVRLWKIDGGQHLATLKGHTNNRVECVAFSPNGKWLASSGWDSTVRLWELLPAIAAD